MPTLLVIEGKRFQRRALCRLLRAAGADRVIDVADLRSAARVVAEHETASWLIVADPDTLGAGSVSALAQLGSSEHAPEYLLLCSRRSEALERLRAEAKKCDMNLLAALRKPVSVEELDSLFRRLPASRVPATNGRSRVLSKDELGECLRIGRIKTRFQPKVDLGSGLPVSCEALPYVTHLQYGDIPPQAYAAAMAQLGAQRVMTASVLRDAANFVRCLRDRALKTAVAVNVSPEVLSEPGDAATLDAYVRTLGIAPADLAFEIGEGSGLHSAPHFLENLARLKIRGYALAIDDTPEPVRIDHPTHVHFSEIKIGHALLASLSTGADSGSAVAAVIRAAHRTGMLACAVDLDTEAGLEQARALGFDLGQGALFSEPLPADETVAWVEREQGARSFRQPAPKRQRVG